MQTTHKTLIATLSAIALLSFAGPVQAQYKPTGEDGITASPKERQFLNEIKTKKEAEALKPEQKTC